MVIASVEKVGLRISIEVISGFVGDHEDLVGLADVEPIGDRAAGRRFRIDFYFPVTGDRGMVVAETRGRTTPVNLVLRWIAREDALRMPDDASDTDWWRVMRVEQIADREYLRRLVGAAKKLEVILVQAGRVSARGRSRDVTRRLEVRVLEDGQTAAVAEEILGWVEGRTAGALRRIMSAAGLPQEELSAAGLDFNNTAVHLKSSQDVSVTPNTVSDLFTYRLGMEVRPGPVAWEHTTRAKVDELSQVEGIELDLGQ